MEKKSSEFICLSCLDWKTTYIRDIQRHQQREPFHIKDNGCLRCGEVKTMEVRYCDSFQEMMDKAVELHKEYYGQDRKVG